MLLAADGTEPFVERLEKRPQMTHCVNDDTTSEHRVVLCGTLAVTLCAHRGLAKGAQVAWASLALIRGLRHGRRGSYGREEAASSAQQVVRPFSVISEHFKIPMFKKTAPTMSTKILCAYCFKNILPTPHGGAPVAVSPQCRSRPHLPEGM